MLYRSRSPWPFPSRSSRTRARTSAAPSTSRRRRTTLPAVPQPAPARTASARSADLRRPRGRARARPRARPRALALATRARVACTHAHHGRGGRQRRRPRTRRGRRGRSDRRRAGGARRALRSRRRDRRVADGVEVVDAPVSIAKAPDPVRASPRAPPTPRSSRHQAVAAGDARRLVSGGSTAPRSPPASSTSSAPRGSTARRSQSRSRSRAPVTLVDVGANTEVPRRAPRPVRASWARRSPGVLGIERPRVGLLSNGEESTKGRRSSSRPTPRCATAAGAAPSSSSATSRATRSRGRGRRRRHRRLHRQRRAEAHGGRLAGDAAPRSATRESSPRAKAGGLLLRPALRRFRDEIDPEAPGGAYLLGLRRLGVVPHGRFTPLRHLPGDPAGRACGPAATSSAGPTPRWRQPRPGRRG